MPERHRRLAGGSRHGIDGRGDSRWPRVPGLPYEIAILNWLGLAVEQDAEIRCLQIGDWIAAAIGHGSVNLHQVHGYAQAIILRSGQPEAGEESE